MTPAARRLLAGDGLHAFGSWIDHLAILPLAAWRFQASPLEMALVAVAGLLPGIVFGPALGRRVDRGDARRWLLASLGARLLGALTGSLAGEATALALSALCSALAALVFRPLPPCPGPRAQGAARASPLPRRPAAP